MFTARLASRPGRNFHFETAWTAVDSKSGWLEPTTATSRTPPLEKTTNVSTTEPPMPSRRSPCGYTGCP